MWLLKECVSPSRILIIVLTDTENKRVLVNAERSTLLDKLKIVVMQNIDLDTVRFVQ